jgi:hypothetical protein
VIAAQGDGSRRLQLADERAGALPPGLAGLARWQAHRNGTRISPLPRSAEFIMKRFSALLALGTLAAGTSALATPSLSLNPFAPKVLPVLVQVNHLGKVTSVSSAVDLAPRYDRMLRQTLDQLITGPAHDHGRAVASQFVINLDLQASPRPDGKYDARFVYVSTSPVPAGSWYWTHIDGHRLALQSQSSPAPRYHRLPDGSGHFMRAPTQQAAPMLKASRSVSGPSMARASGPRR